jgi:hypothetical protein
LNDSLFPFITGNENTYFWSSSSLPEDMGDNGSASVVKISYGQSYYMNKVASKAHLIAVSGEMKTAEPYLIAGVPSENRFVDNGKTVLDQDTGLMWQKTPAAPKTFGEALSLFDQTPGLDGYDDWRLPTKNELLSIVDFTRANPSINTDIFDAPSDIVCGHSYWTSTSKIGGGSAWVIDFGIETEGASTIGAASYSDIRNVRAVRGGKIE